MRRFGLPGPVLLERPPSTHEPFFLTEAWLGTTPLINHSYGGFSSYFKSLNLYHPTWMFDHVIDWSDLHRSVYVNVGVEREENLISPWFGYRKDAGALKLENDSSWVAVFLSSFLKKNVFQQSNSNSPLRCSRNSVVHNSRYLCDKDCAGSHLAINKLLEQESQIIKLFNSSLTFYSWLIIKQHSIDVTRQWRWMTLSRLDGLNPGKLLGSTDWQLMLSPDATPIIAEMTLNVPTSRQTPISAH